MQVFRMSSLAALLLCGVSQWASAEVRVDGPVEFGIFETTAKELQPGERVLTRSKQAIEASEVIPAKLGTKFGIRYTLVNKKADDVPLTLLYLTPGIQSEDGRHDKLVVEQKLVPAAPKDVMAFEFTEYNELVKGEWRFMVFQGDRLLAEKTFTVQ
ncbi:MAG: DUF3859 domain-containing protein [Pseudomonas sp.]